MYNELHSIKFQTRKLKNAQLIVWAQKKHSQINVREK